MKKTASIIAILLLSLCSCSLHEVKAPSSYTDGTWKGLFEGFWNGMNSNYLFWDIDSPTNEWDTVYDTYIDKFAALGTIAGSSTETNETAFSYFYDITNKLCDSHYSLVFKPSSEYLYYLSPSAYRYAKKYFPGFTEEQLFSIAKTPGFGLALLQIATADGYAAVAKSIFGFDLINTDGTKEMFYTNEGVLSGYDVSGLNSCFSSWSVLSLPGGKLNLVIAGITKENTEKGIPAGCLYYLGSDFLFTTVKNENDATKTAAVDSFIQTLKKYEATDGLTGMVVDLRGNVGGDPLDVQLLFSDMLSKDRVLAYHKSKIGEGRLDYSGLFAETVKAPASPAATALAEKPIAVLINRMTVSMGEIATDFFSGFEKSVTIGETSYGAFGSWNDDSSVPSGCFKVGDYLKVTTPYEQTYLSDGKNYEGKGIEPDIPVPYDNDQFTAGTDGRLLKAFQYVKDNK